MAILEKFRVSTVRPCMEFYLVASLLHLHFHIAGAMLIVPDVVDPGGWPIPQYSVGGCVTHTVDLTCPRGRVAPLWYRFIFKAPDLQEQYDCSKDCAPHDPLLTLYSDDPHGGGQHQYVHRRHNVIQAATHSHASSCPDPCCKVNATSDCHVDNRPTSKLHHRVRLCSHLSFCPQQPLARTVLRRQDSVTCPQFRARKKTILSQMATLYYMCVHDEWEVHLLRSNQKTGAALFLTTPEVFYQGLAGYNATCTITAHSLGSRFDIRTLDLRLCSPNEHRSGKCGLHLRILESGNVTWSSDTDSFYDSAGQWLGLKALYASASNRVTLQFESNRPLTRLYSVWLYIRPTSGLVTVECRHPTFFPLALPTRQDDTDHGSLAFAICVAIAGIATIVVAYYCRASSSRWSKTRAVILHPLQGCQRQSDSESK